MPSSAADSLAASSGNTSDLLLFFMAELHASVLACTGNCMQFFDVMHLQEPKEPKKPNTEDICQLVMLHAVLCERLTFSLKLALSSLKRYAQGRRPQPAQLALMGIGLIGLLVGSLLGERPGVLGMLNLLGWAAGQAGCLAWSAVKSDRDLAASIIGRSSLASG